MSWTRPLVAVGDRPLETRIRRAFHALANRENGNRQSLPLRSTGRPQRIAVLGSRKLDELRNRRPVRLRILQQRTWLVVLIEDRDPGRVLEALRVGDSFIFTPESFARLPLVLGLACVGYCVIPPLLMPALARGQLRLELLRRLTPGQAKALHLLSLGLSNDAIARALHLDQPRTKYLIRSMLKTLRLRNRTQAAVFATREAFPPLNECGELPSFTPPSDSRLH